MQRLARQDDKNLGLHNTTVSIHTDRTQQLDPRVALPPGRQVSALCVGRQDAARLGPEEQAQLEDARGALSFRYISRHAQIRSIRGHGQRRSDHQGVGVSMSVLTVLPRSPAHPRPARPLYRLASCVFTRPLVRSLASLRSTPLSSFFFFFLLSSSSLRSFVYKYIHLIAAI